MFVVATVCTGAACEAEEEFVVESVEEIGLLVCECGYCVEVLSVATFEPAFAKPRLSVVRGDGERGPRSLAA